MSLQWALKERLPYFTKNNPYIIAIVTNSTSNSQIEPVLWCQNRPEQADLEKFKVSLVIQ